MASIPKILFGIIWFILACLFTSKAWYIVPVIYDTISDLTGLTLLKVLFWVGLALVWTLVVLVTPAYIIIKGYKEEDTINTLQTEV